MPEKSALAYCPRLDERISRLRSLYERRASDRIFAVTAIPSPALDRFRRQYGPEYCDYPEMSERCRFWDEYLAEKTAVFDDAIPSAYLSEMDQALYGGLVGGEGRFLPDYNVGWITSMVFPILKNWDEFDRLRVDMDGLWGRRYKSELAALRAASRGQYGVSHLILIDSLNFVFELFGATQTYVELLDHPDKVRQAIDFAFDLNVRVQEMFFREIPLVAGGTASFMGQWVPGRIISESVDPFHMTSVACFEEWGRAPAEKIMSRFDGGLLHIHGNGRHLLPAVSSLAGLQGIFLGDDKGYPPAFDVLADLRRQVGDMPLVVTAPYPAFSAALKNRRLPGGALYRVDNVPDADAANRLMDSVRGYRV